MKDEIKKAIKKAIKKLYPEHKDIDFSVEYAPANTGADFASNTAMVLAKKVSQKPVEAANAIMGALESSNFEVSVADPGFLNFVAPAKSWQEELKEVLEKSEKYGTSDAGRGKKVNIESVSANPTGPLTVGHGRGAVIGQLLANTLHSQGFNVEKDYYYNDAGLQMQKLGESVRLRAKEILGEKTDFPEDLYQGEYIRQIAQEYINENNLSTVHDDLDKYAEFAAEKIFKEILSTLEELDVDFDNFVKESDQDTNSILADLKKAGVVKERDRATWLVTGARETVIVRSTGEPTYRLPDIAYHLEKVQKYDRIVNILGADHIDQFPDIKFAVEKLGEADEKIQVIINQFVTLAGGPSAPLGTSKKMSTRAASYVTLDELVAEVGADVTKFFFALSAAKTHMKFDLDLARDTSDKNPLYKIQYAHARINSILDKTQATPANFELLDDPLELGMVKELSKYPDLLKDVSETYSIHQIPHYLLGLADKLHSFYEKVRVISDDDKQTSARVGLVTGVQTVLANGLRIMGIEPLKKM